MRKIITVHGGRFDLDSVHQKIESVITLFDRYLDEYPTKTARSKHAVMGPVAKILERAQTGKWDSQALTGYALRVHEMNPKVRGYLSPKGRQALEEGTQQLVILCKEVPVTAVAKVVERIDYGLYYARRKKGLEWLEKTRLAFVRFLQSKYSNSFTELTAAWGEKEMKDITSFEALRYPSRGDAYKKYSSTRKSDVDEFWKQFINQSDQQLEDEDENE